MQIQVELYFYTSNHIYMEIVGYKKVTYSQLQSALQKTKADNNIHELTLASNIQVKSVGTIRNCFADKKQLVSDIVLTKLFKELKFDAIILWFNGERTYFIKK